jgi:hypothetical protein
MMRRPLVGTSYGPEAFRKMRLYGEQSASSPVQNSVDEAIIPRLISALKYMQNRQPRKNWGQYLAGDQLNWSQLIFTGQSQGAGMSALLAKQHVLRRVVLFSSPWDTTAGRQVLAPWIFQDSVTPPERWYAGTHRKEMTYNLLMRSYRALNIPEEHIKVFEHGLPANFPAKRENPYHSQGISNEIYADEWREMFGTP